MDSLYPDTEYFDFTQLNYWPANPALRRINLRLYTLDPTGTVQLFHVDRRFVVIPEGEAPIVRRRAESRRHVFAE